jgi:hypothetical protein
MCSLQQARVKSEQLCMDGINDAIPELMEEGGIEEVLRFIRFLLHGETIPSPVVLRLEQAYNVQVPETRTA